MKRSYIRAVGLAGVYNELDEFMAGQVIFFASATIPAGWLECNGATVSRTTYATLFAAIGTDYGAGDGATTFQLPDLRGEFIRGADRGRGVDTGRVVGSGQAAELGSHNHVSGARAEGSSPFVYGSATVASGGRLDVTDGSSTISALTSNTGGAETRPRNVAMVACIKY
jgi:microcystin-dependent protein